MESLNKIRTLESSFLLVPINTLSVFLKGIIAVMPKWGNLHCMLVWENGCMTQGLSLALRVRYGGG